MCYNMFMSFYDISIITPRQKLTDIVCILTIGFGFGGLGMYWYTVNHPQTIIEAQPHILLQPQDNTAGKIKSTQPDFVHEI